jgi:hypothetical protein
MKYCCPNFGGHYLMANGFAPNIRIVKFKSEFLISNDGNNKIKNKKYDLKYFITLGYDKFRLDLPMMNINFCPYCGTNLYSFYDKDEYANEIEGETFTL